jgi:hypothetical protein
MDNRHLATRKIGRISGNITLKKQHQDATISRMFTRFKSKELQKCQSGETITQQNSGAKLRFCAQQQTTSARLKRLRS